MTDLPEHILAFSSWLRVVAPARAPSAVPATLLLYGAFFYVGMVNFLFSVPFLFWAWAFAARISQGEKSRGLVLKLSAAFLAVYFSHLVSVGVAVLGLLAQELAYRNRPGARSARWKITSLDFHGGATT